MTPYAQLKHNRLEVSRDEILATSQALHALERRLHDFIHSSEDDFLDIGSHLRQFHAQAGNLARRANGVVTLMLGDEIAATVDGLEGLLEQLNVYTRILDQEAGSTEKGLRNVLNMLGQMIEPVQGFKKIVKTMNILGLSTKVENAQYLADDLSFFILADDLRKLACNIDDQADFLLRHLDELASEVGAALRKVHELRQRQRSQALKIIANTRKGLNGLTERHQTTTFSARRISDLTRDISLRVGEVVASLQFHDLTRQQIEHVIQALRDLGRELEKHAAGLRVDAESQDTLLALGEILHLQEAQISSSRDELVNAVQQVKLSLHDVAVSILAIARETAELAGMTDETGNSFLTGMETGMRSVAQTLEENSQRNRESTATIDSLAHSVGQMENFLHEIENIGAEMKVLALNAGIKATRVSGGGAGLGVISEAIQKLSATALLQTGIVARQLRQVAQAARSLGTQDERLREERTSQVEEFVRELENLLGSLHLLNLDVIGNLKGMDSEGRALAEKIERVINDIRVQELATQLLGQGGAEVAKLSLRWREKSDNVKGRHRDRALQSILGRYSMQRERRIHQIVTGLGSADPSAAPARERKGQDLGDNVELF